ncbi:MULTISPECIES: GNAT family N-acetyltransferase [unclassified Streptomyces]|uniref:GNAT family N-acetyltransferase n=1 Tax=unclassified Streptomyces TaxID=2593676 RepID=UPI002E76481B|nr:GNAT family N-acetyltransferase [Streptomyces sp. JV176]MEE1800379.1 GNAT family N-acetyltransferase [Streptomyces sp. JV176]
MSIEVRTVTEAGFADWNRALNTGFLRKPTDTDETVQWRLARADLDRTQGAFENGRCVATFRSFAQELTVIGGAVLRADAVSNVTVSPTHRRRGLLSRMMGTDLAWAKERGDTVATLIAAEYPIYGRYGFGPAASVTEWAVDVARSGLDPRWAGPTAADGGGRIDLVDASDVRKLGPELHERFRAGQPGAVDRDERWWGAFTGQTSNGLPWTEPYYAVYRSASGEVAGLVVYASDGLWGDSKQPLNTVSVRDLIALTPAAERALWRFVCSIDWVTTVRTGHRAPDDLLPYFLPDPRAARIVTQADFLWVRILDVVRALEARTYAVPGTLVLEIHDAAGLAGGRFRLDASPEGASCTATAEPAELALDVRELGALYLGDESALRLAALGTVAEERPGAAAVAEALFRTPRRPWCPDVF